MSKLAKALYDNTAECADELAFRKGDIVTVMDQNVAGTSGWWMCSLYGRHGLAPANRLKLLPQTGTTAASINLVTEKSELSLARSDGNVQNIYQIPSVPRPTSSPTYERMDVIYKAPSTPLSTSKSPIQSALQHSPDGQETNKLSFFNMASSPKGEVYDVPCQPKRASLFKDFTTLKQFTKKTSMTQNSDLEKIIDSPESLMCSNPADAYVYAVPPPLIQDPNYDIPVASAAECQQKVIGGYNTLPVPRKSEWIYDIPAGSEKPSPHQSRYDTLPSKAADCQLYDTLPARVLPIQRGNPTFLHYDIPKSTPIDISSPPKLLPQVPLYDKPPTPQPSEKLAYEMLPKEEPFIQNTSEPCRDHKPLEVRGDPSNHFKLKRACWRGLRDSLPSTSFHDLPGNKELLQEDERGTAPCPSAANNQRISTVSSSSTSSCDSLPLSSSSPEPHREVTLSQDEACQKLFDLQEYVCRAVPQLMDFVSSNWRCKEHLEKHRKEIKEAAEDIVSSLMGFLNFALDVKGNARRLTDGNLQNRLNKQLSIIEDSGVILQQTVSALNTAGWPLNVLCQEPGRVQTPDQLDRFVMVARTVPDDVKRLVSIIHANAKLLFKTLKDPESVQTKGSAELKKSPDATEQTGNVVEEDDDYVQLQTKEEKRKQEEEQRELNDNLTTTSETVDNQIHSSKSSSGTEDHQPSSLSEHSRLYFGALQKAIGGFVDSLQDGQPPEKFISQSKLVIMVGQRLVDTLCRRAQHGASSQGLLCKSNHLCALLKQLAVATKKAALHFPDVQALHEAKEFAKELAQRAQHFRISLEL